MCKFSVFLKNKHNHDGRSLLRVDFVERDEHGGIDGVWDVGEGDGDALYARDAVSVKFWCGCGVGRLLNFGTILKCKPFVGRILGAFGDGVLEFFQGFADGVGHGDVNTVFWVVPINGHYSVLAAIWVNGDIVMLLECIDEVGGVVGGK